MLTLAAIVVIHFTYHCNLGGASHPIMVCESFLSGQRVLRAFPALSSYVPDAHPALGGGISPIRS
jgi:hypothetical protein